VIPFYEKDILGGSGELDTPRWAQARLGNDLTQRPVRITGMQILDEEGLSRTVFEYGERVRVRVQYQIKQNLKNANFVVALVRSDGISCCNYSSQLDRFEIQGQAGAGEFELLMPSLKLVADLYALHVLIWDEKFQQLYGAQIGGSFHVRHDLFNSHFGVYHESADWSCSTSEDETKRSMSQSGSVLPSAKVIRSDGSPASFCRQAVEIKE
jgi:lipopolysaccharide transport system ATP-binding protein